LEKEKSRKRAINRMRFEEYLESKKTVVENALSCYFPENMYPEELGSSMRYSLLNTGKRVRPVLSIAVAELFDTPCSVILPFACAIEIIHTYTLIHDDLPAMDNDNFRRGKPTNHKVYGEAMAILAGDALLTEAFRIMTEETLKNNIPAKKAVAAINEISARCGVKGVVGGQVMDILCEGKTVDFAKLEYIHTHKTGALILASILVGGILSKTKKADLERLAKYGKCIGLAFQIMDDILDIEGDFEKLGKQTGADINKKKNTYPSVLGMKQSRDILNELTETAIKAVDFYGEKAHILKEFANFLRSRQT
jgi:geranylgeranyl diphosphate synthase type II